MICQSCENAIFDAQWGEYKCSINKIVYKKLDICGDFEKGTPKESKDHEEYNLMREDGE